MIDLLEEQRENAERLLHEIMMFGLVEIEELDYSVLVDALACAGLQLVESAINSPSELFIRDSLE